MAGDHRWVLLLPSEATAGGGLDDLHLLGRHAEEERHRGLDVVRALERPANGDTAPRAQPGQHALRLDVDVLLGARLVDSLHHHIGLGESGREVARFKGVREELRPRLFRGKDGLLGRHDEVNSMHRARQQVAILVSQEHHGLLAMANLALDQERLLEVDELHAIRSGDVRGGDHGDLVPGQRGVEVDALEPSAGHGGADRPTVEHSGDDEIVDVARPSRELLDAVLPAHARADDHPTDYRPRAQA